MYTYIIIDDEELIRKGTIKKLEPMKEQVSCIGEAGDGKEGLELISRLHPDFVILDMQMPGVNGMELLPSLSHSYPEMPLIVISGYRNFDYIKQAITSSALEYLLKPFSRDAIQEVVKKAIGRIKNRSHIYDQIKSSEQEKEQAQYEYDIQLIKNLILGYQTGNAELTSKKLGYIVENHAFCIMAAEFSSPEAASGIRNILHDFGLEDLLLIFSSPSNENLFLLLLFVPDHNHKTSARMVSQIVHDVLPHCGEQDEYITIGISRFYSSIPELNRAYTESLSALNQQVVSEHSRKCYYYDENIQAHPVCWEKEEELLFRIEAGMEKEVAQLTEEMFEYYQTIPDCTLSDVKYHCYLMSDQCRKILDNYIQTSGSLKSSSSMQNVVSNIFSLKDLMIYYRQFFLNLTKMIRPNSVYSIDDVIEKIKIYIQRNYQKNLSQEYLSSLFYINRSYLSTLFRERTGEKFVNYINHVRISKSLELLVNTDKKMYQIARSVGYDNVKYYFRIFKKQMKMTPDEYRSVYSKSGKES